MSDSQKIDLILQEIQGIKSEVQGMKSEIQGMKSETQNMKSEMQGMKNEIREMKQRMTGIEITLEHEISHNIKIIAEGHLDLSRSLNKAVQLASDIKAKQEIQDLYIKSHESRLKIRELV